MSSMTSNSTLNPLGVLKKGFLERRPDERVAFIHGPITDRENGGRLLQNIRIYIFRKFHNLH
eukprot:11600785-Heterocapsa_arctica.AAC.1